MKQFTKDFNNMNINDGKNKNKHKNKKNKGEDPKEEKPKEPLTEEEKFQEELTQIKEKLRELKNCFDRNKPKPYNEDKIENYILLENIVDYDKVKQKIIECFNSEDIYSRLLDLWNKTIEFTKNKIGEKTEENNEDLEDSDDDIDKKKKPKKKILLYLFNKLLMNLNCFIPKVIKNTKDNTFKEKISETIFINIQLVKEIEDGDNFLYYFSEVFDVKEILKNKFINEHKDITVNYVSNYLVFGLHIIRIFDLQDLFPIEKIFKIISDNHYYISYLIYSLLAQIYIKNDENKKYLVLDNIFKLLQEEKNIAQYNLVYELVNKDFQNDEKKSEIIKKFISYIRINLEKNLNMYTVDQAIFYCKLIFENSELFDEEHLNKTKKFICNYFNNLKPDEWKKNLSKLNKFEYKDLKDFLNKKNLVDFFYLLPLEKIDAFAKILKFLPKETDKLLKELSKKKSYNDGLRLIKMLKLPDEEIPLIYKEERMKLFFHYKIKTCEEEDNPHNLIDYCLISKQTFDASIKKILNRYYNGDKYNYFYLYVINEIYYGALNRKIKMPKNIKKEIEEIYYNLKYKDKYSFDDYFGPVNKDCIKIDKNKTKVFFIDDLIQLDKILNQYFINSQYVGIDSEWQQNFKVIDKTEVSIIQIANYDENCCAILDMLEFSKEDKIDKFCEIFEKYFKGKVFLGFYFDKSDLGVFPLKLRNFFENKNNCTIYDLSAIAQQKYLEKGQSLKILTEKIFGKPLCKYEQCSDWNLRPLSKCQIHYGALDALICIMIFKKIMEK